MEKIIKVNKEQFKIIKEQIVLKKLSLVENKERLHEERIKWRNNCSYPSKDIDFFSNYSNVWDYRKKQVITEGLDRTYPPVIPVRQIIEKGLLYDYETPMDEKENGCRTIKLNVKNDEESIKKVEEIMNACGYFKELENTYKDDLKNEYFRHMRFCSKYDIEATTEIWGEILYHITPTKNLDKISKNGLVPRFINRGLKHPERIYFTLDKEKCFAFVNDPRYKDSGEFAVLTLKFNRVLPYRFFYDPYYGKGVYTYDNIKPSALQIDSIYNKDTNTIEKWN
jgi:hypothetical protein